MLRTLLALVGLLILAAPTEAQLVKEIRESARQKVAERKQRTRVHAVHRATEPVDSALERGMRPVDTLVSKAGTGAGSAVSRIGREKEAAAQAEERRLRDALALEGRADLSGLVFAPGSDALEPGSERYVASVANVLAMEQSVFLIEGRAGIEDPREDRTLGERRAASVKAALVALGIPAGRLFSVGRPEPAAVPVSLVRMQ